MKFGEILISIRAEIKYSADVHFSVLLQTVLTVDEDGAEEGNFELAWW